MPEFARFNPHLRVWLVVCIMMAGNIFFSNPAFAGYDEGVAAYKRKQYSLAFEEFLESAKQGHIESQRVVAVLHLEGRVGVPKNPAAAAYWFTKAAEQGDAKSQHSIAHMYQNGTHTVRNTEKAIYWYLKAAKQDVIRSHANLGSIYMDGNGVPKDFAEAAKWFLLPANSGMAKAQYNLGAIYAKPGFKRQNLVKSYMWFSIAARSGLKLGINSREQLATKMTEGQIAEAKLIFQEWVANWRARQGLDATPK
jgi:uncharacterized protein